MTEQQKGSVLITGASTGIGKACALLLDRSGYQVFAGIRSPSAAESLQQEASATLLPLILDITDSKQIAKAVQDVTEDLGEERRLIGLINNAGIVIAGPIEFLPIESLRQQMEVNLIGHIAVTQAFLPLIRKSHGRIVNITTAGCKFASPFLGPYVASKIGMELLSDSLRRELLPWGIHVSIIEPGVIATPTWEKSFIKVSEMEANLSDDAKGLYNDTFSAGKRFMRKMSAHGVSPEVVAKAVRQALEARRPKIRYLIGFGAWIPNLIATFVPDRLLDYGVRKVLRSR